MNGKLSLIIGSLRGGGAERVCVTLANNLAKLGYDVDVVVINLVDAILMDELSSEVNLINLDIVSSKKSLPSLIRYIKFSSPRVVLSFNEQISVALIVGRRISGQSFRLVSRNITLLSMAASSKRGVWHRYIANHIIRYIYPYSDHFIAQSKGMKSDLVRYLGLRESAVSVIPNPVDPRIEKYISQRKGPEHKGNYILCVGRLERTKAFHYAIEAFAEIAVVYPWLRLKVLGRGSMESWLKAFASELKVADRVDFEGFQKNLIPYYSEARATILTSLYEGFPNALVESIVLGTPAVSFDCQSGPSEIIVDGVNGYLVQYKNAKMLAARISDALEGEFDPCELESTVSHFNSKAIVKRYIDEMLR